MKEHVIPLGGRCGPATELIARRRLSNVNHLFDHVRNLDGGLCNGTALLRSESACFVNIDNFAFGVRHEVEGRCIVGANLRGAFGPVRDHVHWTTWSAGSGVYGHGSCVGEPG